jgi:pyruvate kinase
LRLTDLRSIQTALMPLGLSSLGRCEGRVRPNIAAVIEALTRRSGRGSARRPPPVDGGPPDEEDVAYARSALLVAGLRLR